MSYSSRFLFEIYEYETFSQNSQKLTILESFHCFEVGIFSMNYNRKIVR
jgi:hypothetical protein